MLGRHAQTMERLTSTTDQMAESTRTQTGSVCNPFLLALMSSLRRMHEQMVTLEGGSSVGGASCWACFFLQDSNKKCAGDCDLLPGCELKRADHDRGQGEECYVDCDVETSGSREKGKGVDTVGFVFEEPKSFDWRAGKDCCDRLFVLSEPFNQVLYPGPPTMAISHIAVTIVVAFNATLKPRIDTREGNTRQ